MTKADVPFARAQFEVVDPDDQPPPAVFLGSLGICRHEGAPAPAVDEVPARIKAWEG